jgi:hypothetical protein
MLKDGEAIIKVGNNKEFEECQLKIFWEQPTSGK